MVELVMSLLNIGDKVKDNDGVPGIVVEIKDNGDWIKYECRPWFHGCDIISGKYKKKRTFWTMRKHLTKI